MKYLFLSLLLSAVSLSSFADCISKAQDAALSEATNGKNSEELFYSATAELVDATDNGWLHYSILVDIEINDGASSDYLPSEVYEVVARGTEENCRITSVKEILLDNDTSL